MNYIENNIYNIDFNNLNNSIYIILYLYFLRCVVLYFI